MRLDKYLKVSRLIKRRTIAKEILDLGFVKINDRVAKPSSEVKVDDIILYKYATFIDKVCPKHKNYFSFEDEYERQCERDSWF
mgnify:CR=1 FL=1